MDRLERVPGLLGEFRVRPAHVVRGKNGPSLSLPAHIRSLRNSAARTNALVQQTRPTADLYDHGDFRRHLKESSKVIWTLAVFSEFTVTGSGFPPDLVCRPNEEPAGGGDFAFHCPVGS